MFSLAWHYVRRRERRNKLDNDVYMKEEAATAADEKALRAQGRPAFFAELPVIRLPGPLPVRP